MKINSKLRSLVKQYKDLPEDSECLCAKHTDKHVRRTLESYRLVCPRCGGSGYINKRRETLRAAYESWVANTRLFYVAMVVIALLLTLNLIND